MMINTPLLAQDKIEREFGIKEKDVPKVAREWLSDAFETTKRLKWYQEVFESGYSFEAKFKFKGRFYSVEFDSAGIIQDVEIEKGFDELPMGVKTGLSLYLSKGYRSSDIKRIQIQYSGEANDLKDFFLEKNQQGIVTRFEIEYIGFDETGVSKLWEGLFSEDGELIRRRKIVLVSSDNLIF